jgi:cysteinyl-tRNA synthetase
MTLHHLGQSIDIHGGGNDLIFPHHENEIAQSESLTGKPFARYWVHNGMLQLSGEKMSKSVGNLVSVGEMLAHHEGNAFRMLVLNSSYRNPLTFTEEVLEQSERALERLRSGLRPAEPAAEPPASVESALATQTEETRQGFEAAMDDDFNTAGALGHLFELVRIINQAREAGASAQALGNAQEALEQLAGVLGLRLRADRTGQPAAEPFIDLLIEIRESLRRARQWDLADQIRNRLAILGVTLEDGKSGTTWHR